MAFAPAPPQATAAQGTKQLSVAATRWIDTGLSVRAGQTLRITASGSWTDGSTTSGPDGSKQAWPDNFFNLADLGACNYCAKTKTTQWGALIGFIGQAPPAAGSYTSTKVRAKALKIFYVGQSYEAEALQSGELWLSKNADAYSGYTQDNSGHVQAEITVLAKPSARATARRAHAAALSAHTLMPLQQAETYCVRSAIAAAQTFLIQKALKSLLGDEAADLYDGATIAHDAIIVDEDYGSGNIYQAEFDLGTLVFDILGEDPQLALFGVIGAPAIDCLEAGFWLTGQLGGQLGRLLRQRFDPKRVADASLAGGWTVSRTILRCVHAPDGCRSGPMRLQFSHCTPTRCLLRRLDIQWNQAHAIERHGDTWTATFNDNAIQCDAEVDPARLTFKFTVVKAAEQDGNEVATLLRGTYAADGQGNPSGCNSQALEYLRGHRT